MTVIGNRGPLRAITDLIAENLTAHASRMAVRQGGRRWSYRHLDNESRKVQQAIEASVSRPRRLVLSVPQGPQWVAAILGIWRACAIPLPVNLDHPPKRLHELALGCDAVLHCDAAGNCPWPAHVPLIKLEETVDFSLGRSEAAINPPEIACILHTSGSSGRPKPVLIQHAGLANRIEQFNRLYNITPTDKVAQLAAASVDVILWETLLALTSGAQLHIPAGPSQIPGPELAQWMFDNEITVATMTPTMLAALPCRELPKLRLLVLGGEALDPTRFRYWIERHQVANAYGPTEATIATHVNTDVALDEPAPIGHPVPGVLDFLLNEDRRPVPDGQIGELFVGGVGLAAGYDGMPEQTAERFPELVLDGAVQRVYRTGDLAWRRPDGQLVFVGRADRQLNIGGLRLEPEEVEAAALRLPGVTAAAVVPEKVGDRDVLAIHVAVPEADISVAQLRIHLALSLPAPAVPARIHIHSKLPLMGYGKPDLKALASAVDSAPVSHEASDAENEMSLPKRVVQLWIDATGGPPSAIDEDFFDVGGESLAAILLIHKLNEEFGTQVTIGAFVANPTPEHLSQAIANREQRGNLS